jgi:hypothetical protein
MTRRRRRNNAPIAIHMWTELELRGMRAWLTIEGGAGGAGLGPGARACGRGCGGAGLAMGGPNGAGAFET